MSNGTYRTALELAADGQTVEAVFHRNGSGSVQWSHAPGASCRCCDIGSVQTESTAALADSLARRMLSSIAPEQEPPVR